MESPMDMGERGCNRSQPRRRGVSPEQSREAAGRFRLPIERLHPRDFTRGIFHGGDRPIDQYWRICVGIKGMPMPPYGPSPGSKGVSTPEEIWDVVNYVRSLSAKGVQHN